MERLCGNSPSSRPMINTTGSPGLTSVSRSCCSAIQRCEFRLFRRISNSGLRLNSASNFLFHSALFERLNPLLEESPISRIGASAGNLRWSLNVTRQAGNSTLDISDRKRRRHSIYADVVKMIHVLAEAPADPDSHAAWLEQQGEGDLAFDGPTKSFVAVRGARMARLDQLIATAPGAGHCGPASSGRATG